jgi:VWFA-related protein
MRFRCFLGIAVTGAIGAALFAQPAPPQQTPTFRANADLVPIDVRVLDSSGKAITDLKAEDFTIRENGVPQAIRHFAAQIITPEAATAGGLTRVSAESPLQARNRRVFLLVLGGGRLQHPSMGMDASIRFLREQVFPQDYVAILGYNRATDFTTSRDALLQVLEQYRLRHERINTDIEECARNLACAMQLRDGRYPREIQIAIDGVFAPGGLVATRELPDGRVADSSAVARDSQRIADDLQRAEILDQRQKDRAAMGLPRSPFDELEIGLARLATGAMSFDEYAVISYRDRGDLGKLYTGIDYLRYVDGEKHLIYVTQNGMLLPRMDSDFSVAAAANDARVAISVIQTGGHALPALPGGGFGSVGAAMTSTHMQPGEPLSQRLQVSSMRTIADLTGGSASIYEFSSKGFDRVAQATSASYLLGYYPQQTTLDGQYRRIDVRVNRRGAQVLFRHGYFARPALAPIDARRQMTYTRIASAINQTRELRDLPITMINHQSVRTNDGLEFSLQISVDPKQVGFGLADGRHRASLQVAVFCQDANENPVGDVWQTINLNLTDASYEQMMRNGVPHTARVRVSRPVTGVKVAVYDYASDRIGTAVRQLR